MAQTRFSGPVKSDNGFSFDTTTSPSSLSYGQLAWNTIDHTVDLQINGDVTLQLGQEIFYRVINQSGSAITDGTPVQADGALGNSGRIKVVPAQASTTVPAIYVMGVATEDIPNGEEGFVTAFGLVRGIDTRGGDENWQDGDLLYVSATTAGAMTNVRPSAPYHVTTVAIVTNAAPQGNIFVRPTYSTHLSNLSDVKITNPQNGDVLKWDSANQWWYNTAP